MWGGLAPARLPLSLHHRIFELAVRERRFEALPHGH